MSANPLDEIVSEWEKDAKLDPSNIKSQSLETPHLHAKYIRILSTWKQKKTKKVIELNELKRVKTRWMNGELSLQECKERGWEQWQFNKPLRTQIPEILSGDSECNAISSQLEYIETVIYVVENIIKMINQRDFTISNYLKQVVFENGGRQELSDLTYYKLNETIVKFEGDEGIMRELSDYFSFDVPGKQYNPKFRAHLWDGKIRLFNLRNQTTLVGLIPSIVKFCVERNYSIDNCTPSQLQHPVDDLSNLKDWIKSLNLPFTPRDYQLEGLVYAIQAQRGILLSPTGCLREGSKVVMWDGSLKNVEDIKEGDQLLGTNNNPANVLSLYKGTEKLYEITPSYSKPIVVNKDHVLSLYNKETNEIDITTVDDWVNKVSEDYRSSHYLYKNKQLAKFKDEVEKINDPFELDGLDPYLVGHFITCGYKLHGMVIFWPHKAMMDCVPTIRDLCLTNEYSFQEFVADDIKGIAITGDKRHKRDVVEVQVLLNRIFTSERDQLVPVNSIPEEVFTSSSEYRRRVYEAMTTGALRPELENDFRRLVGSLGYGLKISTIVDNDNHYYDGYLSTSIDTVREEHLEKFSIKQLNKEENWYGFELDNNHLFYNDDYTVLHNSGKSLTIYMIMRWHLAHNRKCVIIVPSIGLVEQMISDFKEYAKNDPTFDVSKEVKGLHNKIKTTNPFEDRCVVSTFQSLVNYDNSLYETWDCVIVDEVHRANNKSISTMLNGAINAPFKIGLTGSLSSCVCHEYQLTGSFGAIKQLATTNELQHKGQLNSMKLYMIDLKYPEKECKQLWKETKDLKKTYKDELDFVNSHTKRQLFIRNLACSLKGTTLVLFRFREHGELLYKLIKEKVGDSRPVFHIDGKVKGEEREAIRKASDDGSSPILVFSVATSSTGINIKSIENLIICPNKSKITTLQSVGRCLRLADNKGVSNVFDIVDDLRTGRRINYMYKHASERMEIYTEQNFDINFKEVKL